MIEISFGKLLVLALIALIVLGPEKLPTAARTAGALVRRLRGSWDSVRAEVERELQVEEIRRTARESVARMDAAQAELDATLTQVRAVAADVGAAAAPMAVDATGAGASAPADAAPVADAGMPGGELPGIVPAAADRTVTQPALATTGAAEAPIDTHTGDLFAGTASAAPPAEAAAPTERVDGVA